MTIDEIISAAKAAKEKERVVLGRYRLTLADLGLLRTIRQRRQIEVTARAQRLGAMYGEGITTDDEAVQNKEAVWDIAFKGVGERVRERESAHKDALKRLNRG